MALVAVVGMFSQPHGTRHRWPQVGEAPGHALAGTAPIPCWLLAALESLLNLSRVIYSRVNEWDAGCRSILQAGRGGISEITPEAQYRLEGWERRE